MTAPTAWRRGCHDHTQSPSRMHTHLPEDFSPKLLKICAQHAPVGVLLHIYCLLVKGAQVCKGTQCSAAYCPPAHHDQENASLDSKCSAAEAARCQSLEIGPTKTLHWMLPALGLEARAQSLTRVPQAVATSCTWRSSPDAVSYKHLKLMWQGSMYGWWHRWQQEQANSAIHAATCRVTNAAAGRGSTTT